MRAPCGCCTQRRRQQRSVLAAHGTVCRDVFSECLNQRRCAPVAPRTVSVRDGGALHADRNEDKVQAAVAWGQVEAGWCPLGRLLSARGKRAPKACSVAGDRPCSEHEARRHAATRSAAPRPSARRVRPLRLRHARAGNPGPGLDVQARVATCAWVPVCGRVHCVRRRAPERRGQGGEMGCSQDSGFPPPNSSAGTNTILFF